jgi:hypothetical protein
MYFLYKNEFRILLNYGVEITIRRELRLKRTKIEG